MRCLFHSVNHTQNWRSIGPCLQICYICYCILYVLRWMPHLTVVLENNAKIAFHVNRIRLRHCMEQYAVKLTLLAKRDSIWHPFRVNPFQKIFFVLLTSLTENQLPSSTYFILKLIHYAFYVLIRTLSERQIIKYDFKKHDLKIFPFYVKI